jgi:AcrR family transcriptional regulator
MSGLSQRTVLDAALDLAREVGVKAVTMRALGDRLGVSPMATYHYVKGRDALLILVSDEVMRAIQPPASDEPWDTRLWTFMMTMGDALASVPGLADFLLDKDITHETLRYMSQCIAIIREGGFAPDEARRAFMAIYTYMFGTHVLVAVRNRHPAPPSRRIAPNLPGFDELGARRNLEAGFRALVAGLKQTVEVR